MITLIKPTVDNYMHLYNLVHLLDYTNMVNTDLFTSNKLIWYLSLSVPWNPIIKDPHLHFHNTDGGLYQTALSHQQLYANYELSV